jgi:methylmalonyl-CoA mutase N-terminal domain/subunit
MKERFGANEERSWMLRFHTQTAGCSLTAQQPYNNIVRTALEALAAILGGTQSLHTNSFDEAYWTPSEEAVTIAVRTQQLLAYESGVADVVDPVGGSYYVESLTAELEKQASDYIAKIDSLGGAVTAIEQGYQQREIQQASYKYQKMVEEGKQKIVGVNDLVTGESKIASTLRVKSEVEAKQKKRLAKVKRERDNDKVKETLKRLEKAAQGKENTMPPIIECVEAYATIGEICDVLRNVFGVQREFLFF